MILLCFVRGSGVHEFDDLALRARPWAPNQIRVASGYYSLSTNEGDLEALYAML